MEPSPDRYVESLVKRSGTSFYWAMRLLPPEKRHAMYAVYAFCREVDDIVDDPGATPEKITRLDQWCLEIDNLFTGNPGQPVTKALSEPLRKFGLRKEDFLAVIDGMAMDAGVTVRIENGVGLEDYCDKVACAVGRLSNRVFGIDPEHGDRVADKLGKALQLTNILRDVKEDAERNRLYFPADLLNAHGVNGDTAADVAAHPAFRAAWKELAAEARGKFAEADAALAACDHRQMRPAVIMMEMYRRILDRLLDRPDSEIGERVRLTRMQKLWVVLRYGFF
ncbi:MAG: presqualene diphosphate synthase HpnD [Rhodospirillales bacterium]|nr:presqualene diphosphate synthase HpnD [Rhodospirillales bacterium]